MIPKFRYWDKQEQKMYDNSQIVIWNSCAYLNDYQKIFDRLIDGKKGLVGRSLNDNYLMQSNPLTDKNGDEIYEDDIVRITSNGVGTLGVIKKDSFMWYVIDFNGEIEGSLYDLNNTGKIEVIGNVYENPGLVRV